MLWEHYYKKWYIYILPCKESKMIRIYFLKSLIFKWFLALRKIIIAEGLL